MLTRLMLRTCLVEALKDRTLAGQRVYDSSLSTLPKDGAGPFVSVYTGQGQMSGTAGGASRALLATGMCVLVFQYGLTTDMSETDADTDESKIQDFEYPALDEGFQLWLDITGRQLADALISPNSSWGEMAARIGHQFGEVELMPGLSNEDGAKLATHQLSMVVDLVREPTDRNALVDDYLALLQRSGNPRHAKQRVQIETLLDPDLDEAEKARRILGQSEAVWQSTPLGPAVGADGGEALVEALVEIEGRPTQTVTNAD